MLLVFEVVISFSSIFVVTYMYGKRGEEERRMDGQMDEWMIDR